MLLTALVAGGFFFAFNIVCRIAPFGENTWLVYDMKRQYVDYYSYFRTILTGKNNIFYSSAIAMGAGAVGFYTYYLSSPLLFIVRFFDQTHLTYAIDLLIGIKLMLTAAGCDIFLSEYISGETESKPSDELPHTMLFALSYAFCAFIMSNSINPMWLDVFALMPVTIWMLDRLIYKKAVTGYIISLAAMLWCNYYMTFMVCIFIVIWTGYRLVLDRRDVIGKILRVGICSFWAVCLDAVIMLPTLIDLQGSPKDIFILGLETTKGNLALRDILVKMWVLAYDRKQTIFGTPLIYAGVLTVFLVLLYLVNSGIKKLEKICMMLMIAVFWISFAIDKINLMWHAGMEPSGYPYREAFLYVFVCLICACRCFNRLDGIDIKRVVAVGAAVALLFGYTITGAYVFADKRFIAVNITLIATVFILLMLYVVFTTKGRFPRTELTQKIGHILVMMLIVLQLGELFINSCYIYKQETVANMLKQSDYEYIISSVGDAVKAAKEDTGYYHMENMKPREQNDDMMYDYNGITHYSSAGILKTRYFLNRLGFNDDGLYTEFGHDNTCSAESILGIKYLIGAGDYRAGYEKLTEGEYGLYLNPYVLSSANVMDSNYALNDAEPFELQEKIYGDLTGGEAHIFENDIIWSQLFYEDGYPYLCCMCKAAVDGYVYLYLDEIEEYTQNLTVYSEDDAVSPYGNKSSLKVVNLGYHNKGDTFDIYVKTDSKTGIHFGKPYIVSENLQALGGYYDKAVRRGCEIKEISSSRLEITLPGDIDYTPQSGVVMTFPYEKGWKVRVNGERVEAEKAFDTFMFVPVGQNGADAVIEMTYIPEGMIEGAIISAIAIVGIVLMVMISRKKDS